MSKTKDIGIGIIGLGMVSRGYLESFSKDKRVKLIEVADINQNKLNKVLKEYKLKIGTINYKELLRNDEIDLIVVATPHFLHYQMVMEALDAGKDVICEKPLAMNALEAQKMISKAKKVKRHLFVGLNARCSTGFRTVEKVITEGKIGKPFMARISYLGHEVERMKDPNNWKCTKDKAGGGVLLDGGYHVIDIMNMIFGEPKEVKGLKCNCVVKHKNKGEDNAILLVKYGKDLIGEITASFTIKNEKSKREPTLRLRLEVFGTEGSIWTEYYSHDGKGWQTTLVSNDKEKKIPLQPFKPENLAIHFIDCLVQGTKPIVTVEDALRVHKIVDEVYAQS